MKNLILIIHSDHKADIADLFRSIEEVPGFTLSDVEGHGRQSDDDALLSARDKVVGYVPRVRVDILIEDADVAKVLAALKKSSIGLNKHSVYWVTTVEESGRL